MLNCAHQHSLVSSLSELAANLWNRARVCCRDMGSLEQLCIKKEKIGGG